MGGQSKGKQDRVVPVGERALGGAPRPPQLLVNPLCKALFMALDGHPDAGERSRPY